MRATLSGAELKEVFTEIAGLFKQYDRAKVMSIKTTKEDVTFTIDTGSIYTRTVPVQQIEDAAELETTVLFMDFSSFIAANSLVMIVMGKNIVSFHTADTVLRMSVGESVVTPYVPRKGNIIDFNVNELKATLHVFEGTRVLQKALKREYAVAFYGDHAILSAPIVWVRTQSPNIKCVLTLEQMKSIIAFEPEFVEESDRLEFKKKNAVLSMPRTVPNNTDKYAQYRAGMREVSVIPKDSGLKKLVEMERAIGVAEAEVRLYPTSFLVKVSKGGVALERRWGMFSDSEDSTFSFSYMLDILIMCFTILNNKEDVHILAKEGLLCLENTETSILLSV